MRRFGPSLAVGALLFAAYLGWLRLLAARGALPPGLIALWGEAIALAEGTTTATQAAISYPPLPLLLAGAWQWMAGASALPAPAFVAAALAAALGAAWWSGFRRAGLGAAAALAATLLLALHPFALVLVAQGPGPVMVAAGLSGLAVGLAGLHRRGGAPDAMHAGGALALMALAHPAGLLLALAALPCLAVAVPRDMLHRAPGGMVLTVIFPALALLAGVAFVAIVFGGDPFLPFAVLLDRSEGALPLRGAALALALAAPLLALPVLAALPGAARTMPPLRALALGCLVLPVAAVALGGLAAVARGGLDAVAPAIGLGAIAATWLARDARWPRAVLPLLAAGAFGGLAVLAGTGHPAAARIAAALEGSAPADTLATARAVAAVIGEGGAVVMDARAAPPLIAARGTAAGLRAPGDPAVQLAMAEGRLAEPFVGLLPGAGGADARDPLRLVFRHRRTDPAPGYALTHAIGEWRIFERTGR